MCLCNYIFISFKLVSFPLTALQTHLGSGLQEQMRTFLYTIRVLQARKYACAVQMLSALCTDDLCNEIEKIGKLTAPLCFLAWKLTEQN